MRRRAVDNDPMPERLRWLWPGDDVNDWAEARWAWGKANGGVNMLDILRGSVDTRRAITRDEFEREHPGVRHGWQPRSRLPGRDRGDLRRNVPPRPDMEGVTDDR